MPESVRPVVVLTTICVVCAALLASAQHNLGPRVERQTDLYVRGPALARLFQRSAEEVLSNKVTVSVGDVAFPVFFLVEDGKVTRLAVETTGRGGYGGDLVLLIGIDLVEDQFLGMEVVSHSETPGLGARVEEPSFRNQWVSLPATEEVRASSDGGQVDALTGASVTLRAVLDGTNRLVELLISHRDAVLEAIASKRREGGEGSRG